MEWISAIEEYKSQLMKGKIQSAYRGLMEFMMRLRTHFEDQYPHYKVSGSIYHGYMDMTYFAVVPEWLKQRKLKIAVVLIHENLHFEVWLSGMNKQVQADYWKLIKERRLQEFRMPVSPKGADSILEHTLMDNPDFANVDGLILQLEAACVQFIGQVEKLLRAE